MSCTSSSPRIFVAGHRGMVGSAIVRALQARGGCELITRSREELDLVDQRAVREFFAREQVDQVYLAAARVGGIHANSTYPADFIYENLMVQANVIQAAHAYGVNRLLFLGSSCIYPRSAPQPMSEDALLSGKLELSNEPYAVAKIAGIKLCESYARQHGRDYRSVMPTNLYGPGDNYHPENSHVVPAMIRRFHEAKLAGDPEVRVWGTGRPLREFLYVEDFAAACLHVMNLSTTAYAKEVQPQLSHINVGFGSDVTIAALAQLVKEVVGYEGRIDFDPTKPDGTPRKLMDSSRMNALGWRAVTGLREGLHLAYQDFLDHAPRER